MQSSKIKVQNDGVKSQNETKDCHKIGLTFEQKFESDIKKSFSFNEPTFILPITVFNKNLGACLSENGYEYDDHGGRSKDLFIFNLETNQAILKGSDGVRYINEGGAYYINPKTENILTIDEFNNQAKTYLNNQ